MIGCRLALALFLGIPVLPVDARQADPSPGDKRLLAVEESMNRATTLTLEFEVTNQEPDRPERKMAETFRIQGEKRLVEFTAPDDLKGTKILILSSTQMYVYLPAFGKVRRIASTATQGFMGQAFTQNDLMATRFSEDYAAALPSESLLVLTPKTGRTPPYAKIEMTVLKEDPLPDELKYYDAKGTLLRTETRSGYTKEGGVAVPGEIKMVDEVRSGLLTVLTRKAVKVNEAFPDDLFTRKSLEK